MALPYNFEKKYTFLQEDYPQINANYLRTAIYNVFAADKYIEETNEKITFSSNNTLINFRFLFDIFIEHTGELKLRIVINLVDLLKITLFLLVFIALFSKFAFHNYLLFAGIFILVFYFANVIFISSYINRKVDKALAMMGYNQEEVFKPEQQEWLQNPNKCSACGCQITENHIICPSCGLKIKQNPYTKPLDLSPKKSESGVKYHYREKK